MIPRRLYELVSHPDPACATAATQAMYGMRKIILADLERAVSTRCAEIDTSAEKFERPPR